MAQDKTWQTEVKQDPKHIAKQKDGQSKNCQRKTKTTQVWPTKRMAKQSPATNKAWSKTSPANKTTQKANMAKSMTRPM